MTKFNGEVAVVTGGARGLGEALVRDLHAEGAVVIIADVLEEEGKALEGDFSENVKFIKLDVTKENEWQDLVKYVEATFGPISILVNNAAVNLYKPLEEMSEEEYRYVIDVNQVGTFLGMKSVVPSMKKVEDGRIINISSVEGIRAQATGIAYESSKFAIRGMSKTAALDLADYGILVNSVHPGLIETPMNKIQPELTQAARDNTPLKRGAEPLEIAKVVTFLASKDASFTTGAEFVVDGGMITSL